MIRKPLRQWLREFASRIRFSLFPTEYKLAITANNSVTLDPASVVNGADFCVGQSIQFGVSGLPSVHDLHAVWTLPGTFVNTNSDPNCELFHDYNPAVLRPPQGTTSTHCWYVKDGQPLTAIVDVYYRTAPYGQVYHHTITGQFNVHRPTTAPATPYQPDGTPTAQILGGNTLSLGVSGQAGDMNFTHTITSDGFCAGQVGYVQVIDNGVITTDPPVPPINNAPDNRFGEFPPNRQATVPASGSTSVKFFDAPSVSVPASGNVWEDESFSTYLMFNPNTSGSIWVPLRKITWELHDQDMSGTAYSYTDQSGTKQNTTITHDDPSTIFPHWTTHDP